MWLCLPLPWKRNGVVEVEGQPGNNHLIWTCFGGKPITSAVLVCCLLRLSVWADLSLGISCSNHHTYIWQLGVGSYLCRSPLTPLPPLLSLFCNDILHGLYLCRLVGWLDGSFLLSSPRESLISTGFHLLTPPPPPECEYNKNWLLLVLTHPCKPVCSHECVCVCSFFSEQKALETSWHMCACNQQKPAKQQEKNEIIKYFLILRMFLTVSNGEYIIRPSLIEYDVAFGAWQPACFACHKCEFNLVVTPWHCLSKSASEVIGCSDKTIWPKKNLSEQSLASI